MSAERDFVKVPVIAGGVCNVGTNVDVNRLATALADYSYAYLMTAGDNGRPRAVAVRTELIGTRLRVAACGGRGRASALEQPSVALVYLPAVVGGRSLVVDGSATADDDGLIVTPTRIRTGGREQLIRVATSLPEQSVP